MRKLRKSLVVAGLACLGLSLPFSRHASAETITLSAVPTITFLGGGQYAWTYTATLDQGSSIEAGGNVPTTATPGTNNGALNPENLDDYVTMINVASLVSANASSGWNVSFGGAGSAGPIPTDLQNTVSTNDPITGTGRDVLFYYTGPTISNSNPTPLIVGTFTLVSTATSINSGHYVDLDTELGLQSSDYETTHLPSDTGGPLPGPLPASWITGAVLLAGLAVARRFKRSASLV